MNILKIVPILLISLVSFGTSASEVSPDLDGMQSTVDMVDAYSGMAGTQSSCVPGINSSETGMVTTARPLVYSDSYKQTADWGKSRVLKATGWTTFGLGAGMLLGSAGWLYGCMLTDTYGDNDRIGINALTIGGLAFVAASVPQLILSAKYARRAKMSAPVSFALGMTTVNSSLSGSPTAHPAIGMNIRF